MDNYEIARRKSSAINGAIMKFVTTKDTFISLCLKYKNNKGFKLIIDKLCD